LDCATIAANRSVESNQLEKLLRGELDWIVMKCLEKDRNRRYDTANSLAMDVQRYLTDQPVEARAATRMYRLRKSFRRNKASVLAGSAIALALALGTVVSIGQALRAGREANIAVIQAARSEQIAQFLKEMLEAAGPSVARGRDATVLREILDKTAQRVERELDGQPEVQGDLWFTLGSTLHDIGDRPRAITMYQHAVDCYRRTSGNQSTKLARSLMRLGICQSFLGDVGKGEMNAQAGLDTARSCGDLETLADCLQMRAGSSAAWGTTRVVCAGRDSADGTAFRNGSSQASQLPVHARSNPPGQRELRRGRSSAPRDR
jgi:hypothetical protein